MPAIVPMIPSIIGGVGAIGGMLGQHKQQKQNMAYSNKALGSLGASGGPESLHAFRGTLEALERAVKVLDDRSAAQGMVIT